MIDRAGQGGSSKINFVITHYFVDQNRDYIPEYWCYKPSQSPECEPVTKVRESHFGGVNTLAAISWKLAVSTL